MYLYARHCARLRRYTKRMMLKCTTMWTKRAMGAAFFSWLEQHVDEQRRKRLLLRGAIMWKQRAMASAFNAWLAKWSESVYRCVRACVHACVCACRRAGVQACVCACIGSGCWRSVRRCGPTS